MLVALVLVGVFVAYIERREKIAREDTDKREKLAREYNDKRDMQWQGFLNEQRATTSSALANLAQNMEKLAVAVSELRSDFHAHDQMEREVLRENRPPRPRSRPKEG